MTDNGNKWDDRHYVTVYRLVRGGTTAVANVAAALGVSTPTLNRWLADDDALQAAWDQAIEDRGGGTAAQFRDFVFQQLPPKLRALWEDINAIDDPRTGQTDAYHRVRAMLDAKGTRAKQHLFLYALCHSGFNPSVAMRKLCLSKKEVDNWVEHDPEFAELTDEIMFHKKNFFESGLVSLVASGDSPATIFANRTFNRDRGYADKTTIEHTGSINVSHAVIDVAKLDLPVEVSRALLDAMRKHADDTGGPKLPGTVKPAPITIEGRVVS